MRSRLSPRRAHRQSPSHKIARDCFHERPVRRARCIAPRPPRVQRGEGSGERNRETGAIRLSREVSARTPPPINQAYACDTQARNGLARARET
jgi:hypothetical protein